MRTLNEILETRNLRIAKLSDPTERVVASDILEGKVNFSDYIRSSDDFIAFGGDYYDTASGKQLNYIFSIQGGWEHLSVSMPSKTPSWDQMCKMKEVFFDDEEEAVEYHPKKSEYINAHPHCLHIWRPIISAIFEAYKSDNLVVPGEKISFEEILKGIFPDEETREKALAFYKSETGGEEDDLKQTIQLYDRVPADLLGLPTPPYIRVGTKTEEGLTALKDLAKTSGVQVGLSDKGLDYKNNKEK